MNLFHACSVVLSYIQQTRIHGKIFAFRSINFFIDNIINTKTFSPFLEQSPGEFWLQSLLKQDIKFSWKKLIVVVETDAPKNSNV